MYRFFLFLAFSGLVNLCFAQRSRSFCRVKIIDSDTKKGIQSVTVKINQQVLVTDEHGDIEINENSLSAGHIVKISCIGYNTQSIVLERKNVVDTIKLSKSIDSLSEVTVKGEKYKSIQFGNFSKSNDFHWHPNPKDEFAEYFPNVSKIKGTIKSVEFKLNNELNGIGQPFKIAIYSKTEKNIFPDTDLTKKDIIISNPQKKRILTVDLLSYNIEIPSNGFFVVFETLPSGYYSTDSTVYHGSKFQNLPGIDFTNNDQNAPMIDSEEKDRGEVKYAVFRENKTNFESWTLMRNGIDFAISVTVVSN